MHKISEGTDAEYCRPASALHDLSLEGDAAGLAAFLATDAGNASSVNAPDSHGFTPLQLATDRGTLLFRSPPIREVRRGRREVDEAAACDAFATDRPSRSRQGAGAGRSRQVTQGEDAHVCTARYPRSSQHPIVLIHRMRTATRPMSWLRSPGTTTSRRSFLHDLCIDTSRCLTNVAWR